MCIVFANDDCIEDEKKLQSEGLGKKSLGEEEKDRERKRKKKQVKEHRVCGSNKIKVLKLLFLGMNTR